MAVMGNLGGLKSFNGDALSTQSHVCFHSPNSPGYFSWAVREMAK